MEYIVCNLKNQMIKQDLEFYLNKLKTLDAKNKKLIIIPSFIYLNSFKDENYKLGCQDISAFAETTITGEISGKQLNSLGITYVLVGHSERRKYKNEINIDFINKINHAQESNIKVIYCIGESLEDKEKGNTFNILEKQISEVLNNVELKDIIIAYEPVWAIGTGKTPTIKEISNTIEFIKDIIDEKYDISMSVLYGGSVNVENIAELNKIKALDGVLVGSASLNIDNVEKMLSIIVEN